MKRKHYKGYRSFQYLEPDTDYRVFRLVKEVGRVPAYEMGLTPEQEARARRVFEEHLVISLHDHAFLVPEDLGEFSEYRRQVKHIHAQQGFERVPYVAGIENPAEAMPNVVRWLVQHGYSDDDIARAVGGNAMRVLDKVWWK